MSECEPTITAWMFAHPWMTFFIVLGLVEAIAAPFRRQRSGGSR